MPVLNVIVLLTNSLFKISFLESKEIDPNDVNFENITGSLTRKQAEAVRKRIDTLNQSTKRKLAVPTPPSKHSNYPADVRTIFPAKTFGQPSNADQTRSMRPQLQRKSYSEGVCLLKQVALGDDDDVDADRRERHSQSAGVLSECAEEKYCAVHLHGDFPMERRESEEMPLLAGNP